MLRLIYSLGVMHWRCAALSIRGGNVVGQRACSLRERNVDKIIVLRTTPPIEATQPFLLAERGIAESLLNEFPI